MNQLSVYSGIEGFGLAGSWLGWDLIASVENDKSCQSVIKKQFPKTKILGDIYKQNFKEFSGKIDIVTGGFPCQKFSIAGKGEMDLSEWKEMLRAVRETNCRWVVVENVYGLVIRKDGVALRQVCTDLANENFEVFPPYVLPACSVGAWHQRDRVWIVAYRHGIGRKNIGATGCDTSHGKSSKDQAQHGKYSGRSAEGYGESGASWKARSIECTVDKLANGIPGRVERIKQHGNAIVPQLFYEIGDVIKQMEKLIHNEQKPFKSYPGGKNSTGVYQAIINQIPPHEIFITGFAGNCGVLANKVKAPVANFAIDLDKKVIDGWNKIPGITAVNCDAISWIPKQISNYQSEINAAVHKVFIFLDPPYLKEVRSHQANLYTHEMTDPASHKKLIELILKIPFPVMLSHYPCKLYDDALKDWRTVDFTGRTRNGTRIDRLYMNYPEPTALHDYRYIGNDYREREEYKKAKKNMIAKFKRMQPLERNFLISELKANGLL